MPSTQPIVSIVIPAYNAAAFLGATVESVQAQSLTNWELVIVDDGAKDETAEIARVCSQRDARIRLVRQPNAGLARARNRGYAETSAAAPYVIFLDADDIWYSTTLQVLRERLDSSPGAVAAYGTAHYIGPEGQALTPEEMSAYCYDQTGHRVRYEDLHTWIHNRNRITEEGIVPLARDCPDTFASLLIRNSIITPGVCLLRREIVERVGLFTPEFSNAADWDMWLRMSRYGHFEFVDEVLLGYRQHPNNMSANRNKQKKEEGVVFRKALLDNELTSEQRIAVQHYRHYYRKTQSYGLKWSIRHTLSDTLHGRLRWAVSHAKNSLKHLKNYRRGYPVNLYE